MVTKKYIVKSGGLMDRQRPGRITRGLRMAWEGNRRLDFDGTREEWENGRKRKELEKAKKRAVMTTNSRAINYERQGMDSPLLSQFPKGGKSESESTSQSQDKPTDKEKEKSLERVTTGRAEASSYPSQVQGLSPFLTPKPVEQYHTSSLPRKQKRPGTGRKRLATDITGNSYNNTSLSASASARNCNTWDGVSVQGVAQSSGRGGENETYGTYQQAGAVNGENDVSFERAGYEENAYAGQALAGHVENTYAGAAVSGYYETAYSGQQGYGDNGNYTGAPAYHNNGALDNDFRYSDPAYGSSSSDSKGMPYVSSLGTSGPETTANYGSL
ncbi:hypothetical protein BGZ60DRAFT_405925 [Tricladium varicosporioides]|nr:hypothetical protein BGZ60DRAFT_405925 [Hymenoscyphus varicosporioides]